MSGPVRDFEAAYQAGDPPWDLGAPQPEVVRLADEGAFRGTVLDAGCGTGENALLLASRGLAVMGVDGAPAAIARAQAKAAARGLAVPFAVADALDLAALRQRFDTVLDCGLFHVFDDDDRKRYARSLGDAVGSGGQVQLLCFSDEEPPGAGPRRVSEWDLKTAFRGIFVLTRIRPGRFESRLHAGGARAWVATLTRL
ncbi:class I SAM-dependent methyltransferase [Anaeromyxobacter diazotrophicus]|uniref:Transferase n=1 Tax=Anaeromyxobacter diazotrophicus TaxID=2590199 RepID=A0A7I9VJJ8_9BACT|nr:class I SAM-dependent methyltransferase [Anaeromyxobacter diazotrophicus]GEJ56338.1 transferase [Anaeromyxobacter diazotrophicus]